MGVNYTQAKYPKSFKWKPKFLKRNGFKNRDSNGNKKWYQKGETPSQRQFGKVNKTSLAEATNAVKLHS